MATLNASIDVDVPLEFADLEWSEFVLESMFSGYTRGLTDVEPLIDEDDLEAGRVDFTTADGRLVRVSVELDYTPRGSEEAAQEVARAQSTLERDLEKYRRFVLDRCEKLQCRTTA
jgi:hypothetical protein